MLLQLSEQVFRQSGLGVELPAVPHDEAAGQDHDNSLLSLDDESLDLSVY